MTIQLDSAGELLRKGEFARAEKILNSLLSTDETHAAAWRMLASLKLQTGDKAAAVAAYRKLLEIDPVSEEAIVNLVSYHGVRQELDQCEQLLRTAIAHSPDKARYRFMLGNLLLQRGLHRGAAEQMLDALEIEPQNLQVKVALAEIYGRHGDMDKALDVLLPLLEVPTPHLPAVVVFSNICHALNMRDDCMRLIAKVEQQALAPQQRQQLASIKDMMDRTQL